MYVLEEVVVQLPCGTLRAGCSDRDDPDAITGDYLALDGSWPRCSGFSIEAADLAAKFPELAPLAVKVVKELLLASDVKWLGGAIPADPPVIQLRWAMHWFAIWLRTILKQNPDNQ